MIIKNIFKVHPFYYLFALISVLTGNFKSFFLFSSIIIVHEFGHLLMAIVLGWKVEKVLILPFGGITVFNEDLNRPLAEEFLILMCGPLFQLILVLIFNNDVLWNYSNNLFIFNFLPIFPLDGSKFLNIFLNYFLSFKYSHLFTLYISFFCIFLVLVKYKFNLLIFLILIFLFFKIINELREHNNIFNRFLLERYIKIFRFRKSIVIKSLNLKKMRRDYNHIFYGGGKYITEKEMLKKRFDFTNKTW